MSNIYGPQYLPEGFRIERSDDNHYGRITFAIFEDGVTWPKSNQPRSVLDVTVFTNAEEDRFGGPAEPEVSWPSTSDKRPALARALAIALVMAANAVEEATS